MKILTVLTIITVLLIAGCIQQTGTPTTLPCEPLWYSHGNFEGSGDYSDDCDSYCNNIGINSFKIVLSVFSDFVTDHNCFCDMNECEPETYLAYDIRNRGCQKWGFWKIFIKSWKLSYEGRLDMEIGNGQEEQITVTRVNVGQAKKVPVYQIDVDDFTLNPGEVKDFTIDIPDLVDEGDYSIGVSIFFNVGGSEFPLPGNGILNGELDKKCLESSSFVSKETYQNLGQD